jgi:hypothetical protein
MPDSAAGAAGKEIRETRELLTQERLRNHDLMERIGAMHRQATQVRASEMEK